MGRSDSKPQRPSDGHVHQMHVVRAERISSGFVRIAFAGDADFDSSFNYVGYDQWFRLFVPNAAGALGLPGGTGDGWYRRWLKIPEAERSEVRNYTIRRATQDAAGHWEIETDFVVHAGPSGEVDGPAASWALAAKPGDPLGFLDQGALFAAIDAEQAAADGGRVWLVSDETGVPGIDGILASLGDVPVTCLLEVPHADDRRELPQRDGLDVQWLVRGDSHEHGGQLAGQLALKAVAGSVLGRHDYIYTVGEQSMTLDVRKHAKHAGLAKVRIDFCAFWRQERSAA